MVEVAAGVRRVTFPLPLGIDHVHCYLLRSEGGWTIVDTALGLPAIVERWRELLAGLDAPVERIVITHMHPDHVGAAGDLAELTGAPVLQGRIDHAQCLRTWGAERPSALFAEHMRANGTPEPMVDRITAEAEALVEHVHVVADAELLDDGDRVGEWDVVHLPGHADGHITLLRDDGVLVAGDAILGRTTPTVSLWPGARPDPLGDYVRSLGRLIALAPRLALTGHEDAIDDPVGRAHEILGHHEERLRLTAAALADGPSSAYDVSLALFPGELAPSQRRFALAEALSHLERLRCEGAVERIDGLYSLGSNRA